MILYRGPTSRQRPVPFSSTYILLLVTVSAGGLIVFIAHVAALLQPAPSASKERDFRVLVRSAGGAGVRHLAN